MSLDQTPWRATMQLSFEKQFQIKRTSACFDCDCRKGIFISEVCFQRYFCLNHALHTRRIYEAAQRKLFYQIKAVTGLILKSSKLHQFLCLLQEGSGALGRGRRTTEKIRWRNVAVSTDIIETLSKSATAGKTIAQNNTGEKRIVKMLRKDDFRQRREGSKSYQQTS